MLLGILINQKINKTETEREGASVARKNDSAARPQIAKTSSQLGQPRLEAGQTRS